MNAVVHIDYETFSEVDLKSTGVYPYAEHPSTEITACSYQFNDGRPLTLWIPREYPPDAVIEEVKKLRPEVSIIAKGTCPLPLADHIRAGGEIRAHNAQFERTITNGVAGKRLAIPHITIEQCVCTAVKLAASGIPRSLDEGSKALGTPLKNDGGRIEMLQLCKPRKPTNDNPDTRFTMEKYPEKWIAMLVYNIDDVPAERGVDDAVPDLIPSEVEVYRLDQRINDRGIAVNLKVVDDILYVVEQYKEFLAAEFAALTADWMGDGLRPTQREKVAEWVRANGYPNLVDMQAETVKAIVKEPQVPDRVKRALVIYSTYNAKATAKLQAMKDAACADGRLRGMYIMDGAGPGRWSSQIVQLQNLMRPIKELETPEAAAEALELFSWRDLDMVRDRYPGVDLMKVAGSCTRGCLVAPEGKELVFVDLSGIEDRVNAWFFGEEWVLDAYRAFDRKEGPHLYNLTVANSFGLRLEDVDKTKRQWGKVMRLALGYEGGVSAFVTMADTYGINLQELTDAVLPILPAEARDHGEWMWEHHRKQGVTHDQSVACDGLKYLWRKAHPHIRQGWKDLKSAAEQAVEFPGQAFGIHGGKIWFKVIEYKGRKWLHMRLPSGRDIKYYNPRWIEPKTVAHADGTEVNLPGEFRYMGVDTDTRQWIELATYGGKLDENADQGFSSDILRNALLGFDQAGFPIVGHAHDEGIVEVDKSEPPELLGKLEKMMCVQPGYCDGLPLAAEGKRLPYYWK